MARSRSGMPRSIQVGVPSGWFCVTWVMAGTLERGPDKNRGARRYRRSVPFGCRSLPLPARPLARRVVGWALLADLVPLYPLYALLFADAGLSDAEISGLFALWSVIGIVAEVPSGALADRIGRRTALVGGALLAALGFAAWTAAPGLTGFGAGFVLWGLGGALASGAQEALLHDGLSAVGAADRYAQVQGWVGAAGLAAQVPAAGAATVLYVVGGYPLVGWASVGSCLATAVLAARLPEPARGPAATGSAADRSAADGPAADGSVADGTDGSDTDEPGYLATLRAGLAQAVALPAVRRA